MPTPRQFAAYPQEYSTLFLNARHKSITVVEASPRKARRLRDHLYAFRSAALADLNASGELGLLLPLARMKLAGKRLTIYFPNNDLNHKQAIDHAVSSADSGIPNEGR